MNLDVLVDWSKSGSEEEVGRMMVLLSREYGGTYNTRVLGEDQVSLAQVLSRHSEGPEEKSGRSWHKGEGSA